MGLRKKIINSQIQSIHIEFEILEKQIRYLEQNSHIISLDELHASIKDNNKIDPRSIVITFDDGYKNNLEIVMPFLNAKNIPFSVFISTNHIETGKRFPTYILRIAFFENPNKYRDTIFGIKNMIYHLLEHKKLGIVTLQQLSKHLPK